MFASSSCEFRECVDVYLNGKKVEDAIQANEERGVVLAVYRNAAGKVVAAWNAEPGAMIDSAGLTQVVELRGKVEIKVTAPQGMSEQFVREKIAATSTPIITEIKSGA